MIRFCYAWQAFWFVTYSVKIHLNYSTLSGGCHNQQKPHMHVFQLCSLTGLMHNNFHLLERNIVVFYVLKSGTFVLPTKAKGLFHHSSGVVTAVCSSKIAAKVLDTGFWVNSPQTLHVIYLHQTFYSTNLCNFN